MTRTTPLILHPFLIAPFPILVLYAKNVHAIPAREIVLPLVLVLVVTLAAWAGLRRLWSDGARAALVVSSALILFFSFGRGVSLAGRIGPGGASQTREWLVLGAEVVVFAGLVALVRSRSAIPRAATVACNAGSVALLAVSLVTTAGKVVSEARMLPATTRPTLIPAILDPPPRRPDIYFLVLDAYGRSDVLGKIYGFDNGAFLNRLEKKGFHVVRRSTANYCQTALSVSATLSMRYHDDLAGSRSQSRLPLKAMIEDNAVFRTLKTQGYQSVAFATGYDITQIPSADRYYAPSWDLSGFSSLLGETTPVWLLTGRRMLGEPHRNHRERVLLAFDRLPDVALMDGPTICFAHILSPHPPFLFGADGRDLSGREASYSLSDGLAWRTIENHGDARDYIQRYRDQITYITSRVEETIDRILAASPTPPIIVLQGDHGPGSGFDSDGEHPNDLAERMGILNAIYLPDGGREKLDDTLTPVNTFRVILDHTFGTKLGKLPDRNYYSSFHSPYVFSDVTGAIQR